jgi:hypothetical protein
MMPELRYARRMRRLSGVLAAALLALPAASFMPVSSVAATDAPQALPREPGAYLLDRATLGAMVADLDGDGVRELARFVPQTDAPGRMAVEVLRLGQDGSAQPMGEVGLRRGASVDEQFESFRPVDRDKMLGLNADEPARFLIWHDGSRERLLALTIGTDDLPVPCCLTVWEVGTTARGVVSLTLLANTQDNATSVWAADMDGDGVDELFVTIQPRADAPNEIPIRVLRWQGGGFAQLRGSFVAPAGWKAFVPGETDGRPGQEVLVSSDRIDGGPGAVLYRFWVADGRIEAESHAVRDRGEVVAMDGPTGPELVMVPPQIGVASAIDWPAGELPMPRYATLGAGRILGTLGSGHDQRVLVARGDGREAVLDIRNPDLGAYPVPRMSDQAVKFAGSALPPYIGEFPGGLPNPGPLAEVGYSRAFVFGGKLITAAPRLARPQVLAVQPMAALPGIVPIGVGGADGNIAVLFHQPRFDPSRSGGDLASLLPGRLSIAPAFLALVPEPGDGSLPASFPGLVADPAPIPGQALLSPKPDVGVELSAPLGSLVSVALRSSLEAPTSQLITSSPQRVDIRAADEIADRGRFPLTIRVATPGGRGYIGSWTIELRPNPPPLTASSGQMPLSFTVPISGRTDPWASVEVDGAPVDVSDSGAFATRVGGSIFPRDVRISATDPLGRTTDAVVSIVAPFDYRQLPWIGIVALLTVATGGFLLLRVPRHRSEFEREPGDDARLEEID